MFRIISNKALRKALQQPITRRTQSTFKHVQESNLAQVSLSNSTKRLMSSQASGQSNDAMLIVAGTGILAATCAFGYYTSNTSYTPPKPVNKVSELKEVAVEEVIEQEVIEQEVVEQEVIEHEVIEHEVIEQEVIEQEVIEQEVVEQEVVEQEVIEQEVVEQEVIEQEVVEQEVVEQEVIETPETSTVDEKATQAEDTSSEEIPEVIPEIKPVAIPESASYVIVGAGTAANAACRAIRKNQPDAKILIIGNENILPYMRPPLSKELWFADNPEATDALVFKSWNGKERSVFFENETYYTTPEDFNTKEDGAVTVITSRKVSLVDAEEHLVKLETGETIKYEKLLLATGGTPRNHPIFEKAGKEVAERTTLFRNASDFKKLDKVVKNSENVAVIGGGFLGSELACALAANGKTSGLNVVQIYGEEGNMAKVLPRYLSEWTTQKVQKEGVDTVANRRVKDVTSTEKKVQIELDNGDKVLADHVIVCVGIEPNVDLAKSAGLEVDTTQGGFRVNSELEARSDIWVAGDAACFYDINLGRRRVEHHDHAVVSGRLAGENMTGAKKAYKHQSMFWSDLGPDVGYEAIGLVDSSLPTVGVWAKATAEDTPKGAEQASGKSIPSERTPEEQSSEDVTTKASSDAATTNDNSTEDGFGKGVVFYMKEKKIVGILLWNIFSQMPIARRIISDGEDHEDLNSVAKLFNIHQ